MGKRNFAVGEWIIFQDKWLKVLNVGLLSTTCVMWDNCYRIDIPNRLLATEQVINGDAPDAQEIRRVTVSLAVSADTLPLDLKTLPRALRDGAFAALRSTSDLFDVSPHPSSPDAYLANAVGELGLYYELQLRVPPVPGDSLRWKRARSVALHGMIEVCHSRGVRLGRRYVSG